ncbi:uncharacterized protein UTRI_02300 [Ustilago trichophora]|uniref:VHS domain-containing protein n=1 Tax=Ustilago trichophora TaxID=86804 RepID=A0A5C3E8V2_9BASI|nr:uncharacterized protein UTRI_02300 [Ustilago trichophora]
MKKFFRTKEAGTITPLPPTSPTASTSSFGTPRPFDEYQARVAYQATESNRPLSYQAPSASSRSRRGSSDENGYAQPYPPSQRQNTAYESYSDPISAHSQPFRPPFDRSNTSDYDMRTTQPPASHHANQRQSHQQPASGMAALPPPRSLRPAQPSARHRPNNSMSMGAASGATFQNQHGTNVTSMHGPPANHESMDAAWVQRRRSDECNDEDDHDDADDRTLAVAGAPRSAAYPVYSGADGDEDVGEVLISQGRYEETVLRDPVLRDKGKGKKLFGFATGGKDKKAKQERDRTTTSSPIPRASRDRDDPRVTSPPVESQPLPAHERSKEGGWMDRWNKRAHQHQAARLQDKEVEELVASRIGWLSANAYDEQDWMQILPLIDIISHSEAASKEAARALRKEFKYGTVETQRRAVRIWALLTLNASDRFRFQVASKRFLEAVEDTVASSKTPLSVKETMLRVLGVLAFEFRGDAELAAVTKCWNKIKPSDRPKDGEPLENDLFEFRLPQPRAPAPAATQLPARRVSQRYSQHQQQQLRPTAEATRGPYTDMVAAALRADDLSSQQRPPGTFITPPPQQPAAPLQQLHQQTWSRRNLPSDPDTQPNNAATDVVSTLEAAAASMDTRSASYQSSHTTNTSSSAPAEPLTAEEDLRRLHEECHIARSNASVLLDTLLHEGLHADTPSLIDEFYNKVIRSHELIASQIPWASAQADRAAERESKEEALLADLLDAHGRTGESIHAVDEARRRIEEEEEERQVTERSKVEVRLDRSALAQDSMGELYDLNGRERGMLGVENGATCASGSRSPSPNPHFAQPPPPATAAALSPSPGTGYTNGTTASRTSRRPLPVPRSDQSSDTASTRSALFPQSHPQPQPHPSPAGTSLTSSIHSTTSTTSASGESHASHPSHTSTGVRTLPATPSLNINTSASNSTPTSGVEEDELQTPIVPSEKALGKRRAVSVRYPTPPPVGQKEGPPELPPHPPKELLAGMRISQ